MSAIYDEQYGAFKDEPFTSAELKYIWDNYLKKRKGGCVYLRFTTQNYTTTSEVLWGEFESAIENGTPLVKNESNKTVTHLKWEPT